MDDPATDQHKAHVAAIAAAYLGNPSVRIEKDEVADVIRKIDVALKGEAEPTAEVEPQPEMPSAQMIRKSISPDFLVSFIDGKPYKTLRRHLARHGLTPQSYRERYGLKPEYPMVAPNYSAQRSALARQLGLGQIRSRNIEAEARDPTPSVSSALETAPEQGNAASRQEKKTVAARKPNKENAVKLTEVTSVVAETASRGSREGLGVAKPSKDSQGTVSRAISEPRAPSARRGKTVATGTSPAFDEAADAESSGKTSGKKPRNKATSR